MAIPPMALFVFPFSLGVLMMTWQSLFCPCSRWPLPFVYSHSTDGSYRFSLASVIPLLTWCRPQTEATHSWLYLHSASVIPPMTGRPFLLVSFLLARAASSLAIPRMALLIFPFSLGMRWPLPCVYSHSADGSYSFSFASVCR